MNRNQTHGIAILVNVSRASVLRGSRYTGPLCFNFHWIFCLSGSASTAARRCSIVEVGGTSGRDRDNVVCDGGGGGSCGDSGVSDCTGTGVLKIHGVGISNRGFGFSTSFSLIFTHFSRNN